MKLSILSIGPNFDLFAEASATINLDADLSVGVHYELNGLSFTVGSSSSSSPGFAPLDSREYQKNMIYPVHLADVVLQPFNLALIRALPRKRLWKLISFQRYGHCAVMRWLLNKTNHLIAESRTQRI